MNVFIPSEEKFRRLCAFALNGLVTESAADAAGKVGGTSCLHDTFPAKFIRKGARAQSRSRESTNPGD
jgi:hypothetical protein